LDVSIVTISNTQHRLDHRLHNSRDHHENQNEDR